MSTNQSPGPDRLHHFIGQMSHENVGIRERSVKNIFSKLKHGIVAKEDVATDSSLMKNLLEFFKREGSSGEVTEKALDMLLDFTRHHVSARSLIREGGVQCLEEFRGSTPAMYQPHVDAALKNLLSIKVTNTATIYEEELHTAGQLKLQRNREEQEKESERLKLRLRDRIRCKRPTSGEIFFSDLRAKIGHSNPDLALQASAKLKMYVSNQISVETWIEESNVLIEICDMFPIISKRCRGTELDTRILENHVGTLSCVARSLLRKTPSRTEDKVEGLIILITTSLASSLVSLEGIIHSATAKVMLEIAPLLSSEHISSSAVMSHLAAILTNVSASLTESIEREGCGVCSPASLLDLRLFMSLLRSAASHGKAGIDALCEPANESFQLLLKQLTDASSNDAVILNERYPRLYKQLYEARRHCYGEEEVVGCLAGDEETAFKLTVGDARVVHGAVGLSTSTMVCLDALSAVGALARASPDSWHHVVQIEGFAPFFRFLQAPAGNKSDAACVEAVCGCLEECLEASLVAPDALGQLAVVIEQHLIPILFDVASRERNEMDAPHHKHSYSYIHHETVCSCLSLITSALASLASSGHASRVAQLATNTHLLNHLWSLFLQPATQFPPRQPRSSLEWCVTDGIPSHLIKLTSEALKLATVVLNVVLTFPSGSTPECVQDAQSILLSSLSFIEANSSEEAFVLSKCGIFHNRWVSAAIVSGSYLSSMGVEWTVGGAMWGLRRSWPGGFYILMSLVFKECEDVGEVVEKYPKAVADAIAAVTEGAACACEAAAFLLTLVLRMNATTTTLSPEALAAKAVLEESLRPSLFDTLPKLVHRPRALSACLALCLAMTRASGDLSLISITSRPGRVGVWKLIVKEACSILASVADAVPKGRVNLTAGELKDEVVELREALEWCRGLWELILLGSEAHGDLAAALIESEVQITRLAVESLRVAARQTLHVKILSESLRHDPCSGDILKCDVLVSEIASLSTYYVSNVCGDTSLYLRAATLRAEGTIRQIVSSCEDIVCDTENTAAVRAIPCCLLATAIQVDGETWCRSMPNEGRNMISGLLSILNTPGITDRDSRALHDAIGAVMSGCIGCKEHVLTTDQYSSWVDTLDSTRTLKGKPSDSLLLDACTLLINLLHNHPAVEGEPLWVIRLGRAVRPLLATYMKHLQMPRKGGSYRVLSRLLDLTKSYLLLGCSQEHKVLFKDLVKLFLQFFKTPNQKPATLAGVDEVFACLSCCGPQPKLLELVPTQTRTELMDKWGETLWGLIGLPAAASDETSVFMSILLKCCANVALSEMGREYLPRINDFWEGFLHVMRMEGSPRVEAMLLLRNLSFKGLNKATMSRDRRIVDMLLEVYSGEGKKKKKKKLFVQILRATDASLVTVHLKWLATSTLWSLLYHHEKAKSNLRQFLTCEALSPIRTLLQHHFSLEKATQERVLLGNNSPTPPSPIPAMLEEILEHLSFIDSLLQ